MIYKLCAPHIPENLDYGEKCQHQLSLSARGIQVYGPVRYVEADNPDEARDKFLDQFGDDFDLIGCYRGGYVHISEK